MANRIKRHPVSAAFKSAFTNHKNYRKCIWFASVSVSLKPFQIKFIRGSKGNKDSEEFEDWKLKNQTTPKGNFT